MRKYLKYIIAVAVFLVVWVFVGDQSLIRRIGRQMQIRKMEREIRDYKHEIEAAEATLHALDRTDSLERYAREKYYMHTPEETVYVVEE